MNESVGLTGCMEILDWYFAKNLSLRQIAQQRSRMYKIHSPKSVSVIRSIVNHFKNFGCLYTGCKYCHTTPEIQDEIEKFEIMVCAAAELELRTRDIVTELDALDANMCAVRRVLKKYKYFDANFTTIQDSRECVSVANQIDDIDDSIQSNTSVEERKEIIKWHIAHKNLQKVIDLYTNAYKHSKQPKIDVYYTIKLFEKFGCLRECVHCLKSSPNIKFDEQEIDESITSENIEKKVEEFNETQINNKISTKRKRSELDEQKIELVSVERTMGVLILDNQLNNNTSGTVKTKEILESLTNNTCIPIKRNIYSPPPLVDRHGIEFVVLEPTMGIVVINDKSTNTTKKLKLL